MSFFVDIFVFVDVAVVVAVVVSSDVGVMAVMAALAFRSLRLPSTNHSFALSRSREGEERIGVSDIFAAVAAVCRCCMLTLLE